MCLPRGMPLVAALGAGSVAPILAPVGGVKGVGEGGDVDGLGGAHDRRRWKDLLQRRRNLSRRFLAPEEVREDDGDESSHNFCCRFG